MPNQDTPRVPLVCQQCGKLFSLPPFRLKVSPCRFCSRVCWRESTRTGEYRKCEECGGTFYVGGKESSNRPARWCSVACSRIVQRRGEDRVCLTCGVTFYVQRGHLKKAPGNGSYCSEKCKGPRIRELKYRGGPFRMYGSNWNAQRRLARKRDKYTCQDCGKKQGKMELDVHHLKARRSFGKDYISANSLDNLITLCRPCHVRWETAITHSGVQLKFETSAVNLQLTAPSQMLRRS